jgi:hypothetical protein
VWIINYVYISRSSSHKADSDLLLEVIREVIASPGNSSGVVTSLPLGEEIDYARKGEADLGGARFVERGAFFRGGASALQYKFEGLRRFAAEGLQGGA